MIPVTPVAFAIIRYDIIDPEGDKLELLTWSCGKNEDECLENWAKRNKNHYQVNVDWVTLPRRLSV